MRRIKVLVVDDSVTYRTGIKSALRTIPFVEVVGTASNGKVAMEKVLQLAPDLITLDLEMSEMDGIQTLHELNRANVRCKVLVFSSLSKRGAEIAMEALRLGASDFIAKPDGSQQSPASASPLEKIKGLLEPKITAIFPDLKCKEPVPQHAQAKPFGMNRFPKGNSGLLKPAIIVIGSSTGGPSTLEHIFSKLTPPLRCPILIAQHMPPIFTTTFAERISRICGVPAAEGKHGELLENNKIYVAPGDFHMTVVGPIDAPRISLDQGPKVHSVRPAVDPLFSSVARIFGRQCLAFVLTGMGVDGTYGAKDIRYSGGTVVIQSEVTCVVFGMPGAVQTSGAFDRIADPEEITEIINHAAGSMGL